MYEAVHAHPDGDATVARHAATAERYGYEDRRPDAGGARSGQQEQ